MPSLVNLATSVHPCFGVTFRPVEFIKSLIISRFLFGNAPTEMSFTLTFPNFCNSSVIYFSASSAEKEGTNLKFTLRVMSGGVTLFATPPFILVTVITCL